MDFFSNEHCKVSEGYVDAQYVCNIFFIQILLISTPINKCGPLYMTKGLIELYRHKLIAVYISLLKMPLPFHGGQELNSLDYL